MTPQSGNQVSTSLGNSGLCWTVFARNRDTAVLAEGNGDLQTLICVLVTRPRRCLTLSNPVPWQNWMAAYLGYTLWMKTLFRGWPVMVNDMHTRRRRVSFRRRVVCQENQNCDLTKKFPMFYETCAFMLPDNVYIRTIPLRRKRNALNLLEWRTGGKPDFPLKLLQQRSESNR